MNKSFMIVVFVIFFLTCTIWAVTLTKVNRLNIEKRKQLAHEVFSEDEGRMEDFFNKRSESEIKKLFKIGFLYCDLIALESQNLKDPDKAFNYIRKRVESEIVKNLKAY